MMKLLVLFIRNLKVEFELDVTTSMRITTDHLRGYAYLTYL